MKRHRADCRALILSVIVAAALAGCVPGEGDHRTESPYLGGAQSAGVWLQQLVDPGRGGVIPDEAGPSRQASASLGTGAAGRLIFFLELFEATRDTTFLRSAEQEAEAALRKTALRETADGFEKMGLYDGLAGVAFALTELARAGGGTEDYRRAAQERFERLVEGADRDGDAARWNSSNDVLTGTAGIGLALLYAGREFENPAFYDAARAAGHALLDSAERMETGLRWHRWSDRVLDLPNFSHGTAGVAYFLATLGRADDDERFLAAAEAGADYLLHIADRRGGLFLVPYGVPNEGYATRYDIGWAHGPAGTGRLLYRLWQATGNDLYLELGRASARSIIAAGVPGETSDPLLWSGPFALDRRFGVSGVIPFLLDWHRVQGDDQYLSCARRSVDELLKRAVNSEDGLYWMLPRYPFLGPEEDATYTGYFYGVAGIGLSLLEMHYADAGREPRIRLPDDPFGEESSRPNRPPSAVTSRSGGVHRRSASRPVSSRAGTKGDV